jgi:competence protein ComEC
MQSFPTHRDNKARWMMPCLAGLVGGTAVQLQQAALYVWYTYAACIVLALGVCVWALFRPGASVWRLVMVGAVCAVAGFGLTGWRAAVFQSQALAPALEGRDILVTGVVSAMPQVNEAGARFRFQVEAAAQGDVPVRLPSAIYLGWYTNTAGR